ncbi:lysophospholipid acyltransferase family protein [Flocculibacter collagenilyticus]|uniref:lysophospholipid acyltransferase family protein n=1 Tax=Flocculibacter collagenilyticus TaxID=2744479 RepID=UPI0018F5044E|nr:lysophospholipid acyltransferase family protein [Flocculibacter collagenilyticus]
MMQKINYVWRVFATGLCFSVFGIGGLFLTLFVFPVQRLLCRHDHDRKALARKTVHYSFKFFIGLMQLTGVSNFIIERKEYLQQLDGHLVMANHPSLIDVVVLISIIPNADCVVKAHLFKNPFMRGVIKNTGYISNADPEGLLADCKASLEAGNNLIIFPEGTRTTPGEEMRFQRGAANIALRCNAKLTSLLIKVHPTTLTKMEKWYQIPEKRFEFNLQIAETTPAPIQANSEVFSKQSRSYTRELEAYFNEELDKI